MSFSEGVPIRHASKGLWKAQEKWAQKPATPPRTSRKLGSILKKKATNPMVERTKRSISAYSTSSAISVASKMLALYTLRRTRYSRIMGTSIDAATTWCRHVCWRYTASFHHRERHRTQQHESALDSTKYVAVTNFRLPVVSDDRPSSCAAVADSRSVVPGV